MRKVLQFHDLSFSLIHNFLGILTINWTFDFNLNREKNYLSHLSQFSPVFLRIATHYASNYDLEGNSDSHY